MSISQLRMLKLFTVQEFTPNEALKLDQRVFGALCAHRWVAFQYKFNALRGGVFYLTEDGEAAYESANKVHNFRKHNNGLFSVRAPRIKKLVSRVLTMRRLKLA